MGSFCKSGPATTTSTSTTTPAGIAQLNDIWGRVKDAASTPFSPYTGQMVAGVNATQQGGINNITGATSYLDTARDYATAGARGIDEGQIAQYYNPFQRDVVDATQRNFAESNAQADERLKGNSIARGAWGGDRANIGRAELMRQQKMAQDPVIAGLNSQGFNLALAAAQADRAAKAQGGYQFGALGNSAVGQGQAQIGAGSLEQGTDQARLAAQFQEFMRAQAFPYQQAQFMSSAGLPAVTAMGGTTTGSTSSQAAQPSMLSQIVGAGTAAAGAFMGNPMMMAGGMNSIGGGGGTPSASYAPGFQPGSNSPSYPNPYGGSWYGNRGGRVPMNRGGRTSQRKGFDHAGFGNTVHMIRQALRRGGSVMETTRDQNGIYVPHGYASGGWVDESDNTPFENAAARTRNTVRPQGGRKQGPLTWAPEALAMSPIVWGHMAKHVYDRATGNGYADGGDVSFGDRFDAADEAIADGTFDPVGMNYYTPYSLRPPTPATDVPLPRPRPASAPITLPPQMTGIGAGASPMALPDSAMAYDGAPPSGGLRAPPALMPPSEQPPIRTGGLPPFMPQEAPSRGSGPFNLSEDARMGLIAAGLGMMASKAPNALGAIGEGGLQGIKTYTEAKNSRQRNELDARRLMQQAEHFSQNLAETTRYHDIASEDRKDAIAERGRAAKERSEDRRDAASRTAYPGEGVDDKGNTVKGLYQFNPDTREYDFKPGKVIQKGPAGGPKEGQTERLISELRKENPNLTYQEALALTKRAPNGDQTLLRRESLALSAAKADIGYLRDPSATLEKWRKQYGLGAPPAAPGPGGAPPPGKLTPPPPDVLDKARAAIKNGAPKDAVAKRLKDAGMDPSAL